MSAGHLQCLIHLAEGDHRDALEAVRDRIPVTQISDNRDHVRVCRYLSVDDSMKKEVWGGEGE